jgi:hypothetical protein
MSPLPMPRIRWLQDFGKIVYPWIFNKSPLIRKMFWFSFPLNCFCAATHVMSFNTEMLHCMNSDTMFLRHPIKYLKQWNVMSNDMNMKDRSTDRLSSAISKHHSHWCSIAKYCVLVSFSKYVRISLCQTAEHNNIEITNKSLQNLPSPNRKYH